MKKYISLEQIENDTVLYHYTKCAAAASILKTDTFLATKSSFLSDSNEMGYILHIAEEYTDTIRNPSWQKLLKEQILATMEEFKRHDIFVLSFSLDADAITLWSEFGDETGYNLAFNGTELLDQILKRQKIYCHGRVIYSHARQMNLMRILFEEAIPSRTGCTFEEIMEQEIHTGHTAAFAAYCRKLHNALSIYAMFFKQEEFLAEKEYRIVFRIKNENQIHYRVKEGFLLPYIEVQTDRLPLCQITVAPQNHVDLAERGMEQYSRSLGYDVPVVLSRLKLRY